MSTDEGPTPTDTTPVGGGPDGVTSVGGGPDDPTPATPHASGAGPYPAVPTRRGGDVVPFRVAVGVWFRISLQTFGGPAGQIAVMQRTLVEEQRWIGQRRFLHALSFCTVLPGPEAQQLAIYVGWLLNGIKGGLAAGVLFVLPGVVALLALSVVYVSAGDTTPVVALFAGLAPASVAIVAHAVVRLSRRALGHPSLRVLAAAAFLALSVFGVPFPLVITAAAVAGWGLGRFSPHTLRTPNGHGDTDTGSAPLIADSALHTQAPSTARTLRILGVGVLAWGVPVGAVAVLTGGASVFTQQATFFSGAALVTFGGAYAVLAYVAQKAVEVYAWLSPGEMVRGLALAESTPGPLIMVVQFVAFLGAYRNPGSLNPWAAAVLGALLTTWVTFVPCFVFIFVGAPYIERLRTNTTVSAALTGITAAVVGVIANLALYFALHTLFSTTHTITTAGVLYLQVPQLDTLQPGAVLITAVAGFLLFGRKWPVLRTLGVSAALGLLLTLAPHLPH